MRTLLRLRGVSTRGTLEQFFAQGVVLERGAASDVVGLLAGRGGCLRAPSAEAWQHAPPPHALKIVVDLRAMTAAGGTSMSTETRGLANSAAARRAFRLYWSVAGPFSALIRRRWLRAIVRVCADG